jgi:hypothetical protein
VEAWIEVGTRRVLLGSTEVEEAGSFVLPVADDHPLVRKALRPRGKAGGSIILQVYVGHQELTVDSASWKLKGEPHRVVISVSGTISAPSGTTRNLRVVVVNESGAAQDGVTLALFKVVEGELGTHLDQGSSGADGVVTLSHEGAGSEDDLVVRATSGSGASATLLASSEVLYNAGRSLRVELICNSSSSGWPSEFDVISATLGTSLKSGTLSAARVAHLAERNDLEPMQVARYGSAWKLAADLVPIEGEERSAYAQLIYGLLCEGAPPDLATLSGFGVSRLGKVLARAVDNNRISSALVSVGTTTYGAVELAQKLADLDDDAIVGIGGAVPSPSESVGLHGLLDVDGNLGISAATLRTVVVQWKAHSGTHADFWGSSPGGVTGASLQKLKYRVYAAQLLLRNPAALNELFVSALFGAFSEPKQLTGLTTSQWTSLLSSAWPAEANVPVPYQGEGRAEKIAAAVELIQQTLEEDFPTPTFANRAKEIFSGESILNALQWLLDDDVDLDTDDLSELWAAAGLTEDGKSFLLAAQRLVKLIGPYHRAVAVKALLDDGIDSARALHRYGRRKFVLAHQTPLGGVKLARQTFARATQQTALAFSLFAEHDSRMFGPSIQAFPTRPALVEELPSSTLRSLYLQMFGGNGFSDPEPARNVLSPGAYLVDVLNFLKGLRVSGSTTSALDVLLADGTSRRRPDIEQIDLTEKSTSTPLPLIDLVNEILERRLDAAATVPTATEGDATLRRALPQATNTGPYENTGGLSERVWPFHLPYHRSTDESRVWLTHLGLPRPDLFRLLRTSSGSPSLAAVAVEDLRLQPMEWDLIHLQATTLEPAHARWGYSSATGWAEDLQDVPTFLERASCSQQDLYDLCHIRFPVSGGSALTVTFDDPTAIGTGLIEQAGTAPSDLVWSRLASVLRLHRRLGWSILDVDRAIHALAGAPSTEELLPDSLLLLLAPLQRLHERTRISVVELLVLWSTVDTFRGREITGDAAASLYDRLFLAPSASQEQRDQLQLNATRDELSVTSLALGSFEGDSLHLNSALLNALECSAQELRSGLALLGMDGEVPTLAGLSTLSTLLRWNVLGRACGWSLPDTLRFAALLNDDFDWTFNSEHPERVELLLDRAARARAAELSPAMLEWLLLGGEEQRAASTELGVDLQAQADELNDLRLALLRVKEASADSLGAEVDGAALYRSQLHEVLVAEVAARLGLPSDVAEVLVEHMTVYVNRYVEGVLDDGAEVSIAGFYIPIADAEVEPSAAAFLALPLEALSPESWLAQPWLRLCRAAQVIRRLDLQAGELTFLIGGGGVTPMALLDLRRLPLLNLGTDAPDVPYFQNTELDPLDAEGLDWLLRLWSLKASLRYASPAWHELLDAATSATSALPGMLCSATGWLSSDLEHLLDHLGSEASWSEASHWVQIFDAMEAARRLGLSASQLTEQATVSPTSTTAASLFDAVRSRHGSAWFTAVTPIQDQLRQRRRDALLSAVMFDGDGVGGADLSTPERVSQHLLIDVSTSPVNLTSRVVAGLGSAQLLVHRILLGQEQGIELNAEQAEQWSWMKNYRVWEAARKVFLWPENWIEPDLRLQRTPLWEPFASAVQQDQLRSTQLEEAYEGYLSGLVDVANLRVLSFVHHKEEDDDGDVDILYVFARSVGAPARYYWRTCVDQSEWTPWQPLDLAVTSDQLMPVIYHGRLLLLWPEWTEQSETVTTDDDGEEGVNYPWWSAQISFSELRNQTWSAPRQSSQSIRVQIHDSDGAIFNYPPEEVLLRAAAPSAGDYADKLVISAWVLNQDDDAGDGDLTSRYIYCGAMVLDDCSGELVLRLSFQIWGEGVDMDYPSGLPSDADIDQQALYLVSGDQLRIPVGSSNDPYDQPVVIDNLDGDTRYVVPHDRWDFDGDEGVSFLNVGQRCFAVWPSEKARRPQMTADDVDLNRLWSRPKDSAWYIRPTLRTGPVTEDEAEGFLRARGSDTRSSRSTDTATRRRRDMRRRGIDPDAEAPVIRSERTRSGRAVRSREIATYAVLGEQRQANQRLSTFVKGANQGLVSHGKSLSEMQTFHFEPLHHPLACTLMTQVRREGVWGLLRPDPDSAMAELIRQSLDDDGADFSGDLQPTIRVAEPYPSSNFDFRFGSPWGLYHWELFFHAPVFIAEALRKDQQFEEALRWYQTIFDPTHPLPVSASSAEEEPLAAEAVPLSYWRLKPFVQTIRPHLNRLSHLLGPTASLGTVDAEAEAQQVMEQIRRWRENPFDPHLLATLRPLAYQKYVVMRYLDTLIEWGDHLFGQDTMESVNEASLLYVMALELLGPRPTPVRPQELPAPGSSFSYATLTTAGSPTSLDRLNTIEAVLARPTAVAAGLRGPVRAMYDDSLVYFDIPANPMLLRLWDVVDDRLFKIRNGLNLAGQRRTLPLFAPPIDPALLVRAAASGVDLSSALTEITQARSNWRFSVWLSRAQAFTAAVKSLGAALLSALEKKDAEALQALRSAHETQILTRMKEVRQGEVDEAELALEGLLKQRAAVEHRRDHYRRLLDEGWLAQEQAQLTMLGAAALIAARTELVGKGTAVAATVTSDIQVGNSGPKPEQATKVSSPDKKADRGGLLMGSAMAFASGLTATAGILGTTAGYKRRKQEWRFAEASAEKELTGLDKQVQAAEARLENARRNLRIHGQQLTQAREVETFLRQKFSNSELYRWMAGQLSGLYFQAYQLAYQVAQKAQVQWQFETGSSANYIQYGHWDGLRRGLLAGERLELDLARMEADWYEQMGREYEITQTFSLAAIDPLSLIALQEEHACQFTLSEAHYAAIHPDLDSRRIRSVSFTIPAVAGAEGGVPAEVKLMGSGQGSASEDEAQETIRLSIGADDPGVFSLDRGEGRYLPFERRGAITHWNLKLTELMRTFDPRSITDVLITLRYTAVDGSTDPDTQASVMGALNALNSGYTGGGSALGGRPTLHLPVSRRFPDAWHRFLHPEEGATTYTLELTVEEEHLPFAHRSLTLSNVQYHFVLIRSANQTTPAAVTTLTVPGLTSPTGSFTSGAAPSFGHTALQPASSGTSALGNVLLAFTSSALTLADVVELHVLVSYDLPAS